MNQILRRILFWVLMGWTSIGLAQEMTFPRPVNQDVSGARINATINPYALQSSLDSLILLHQRMADSLHTGTTTGRTAHLVIQESILDLGLLEVQGHAEFGANVDVLQALAVYGDAQMMGQVTFVEEAAFQNALSVSGYANFGSSLTVAGPSTLNNTLTVAGASDFDSSVNVDGNTTLGSALSVDGTTDLNNTLTVDGATSLGSTLGVTGATTLANTLGVSEATTLNNTLNVVGASDFDSSVNVDGNTTLGSALSVDGTTDLNNSLTVDGATSLGSTLGVTGATNLNNTLNVVGASDFDSSVNVDGNTTLGSALSVDGTTDLNNTLTVDGATSLGSTLGVTGATNLNNTLNVAGNSDFDSSVNVDGNTTLGSALSVDGTTDLNNTLTVDGATSLGSTLGVTGATTLANTLGVSEATTLNNTLNVVGASDFDSSVNVDGNTTLGSALSVDGTTDLNNSLTVDGSTSLGSTLGVTGATSLGSTLGVTGATTLSNTLGVTGATNLNNTLNVVGASDFDSSVNVDGNTTLGSALSVDGTTDLNNSLTVDGSTSLGSTLGVTGATSLGSTLGVSGATTFQSTLNAQGAVTLGGDLEVSGASDLAGNLAVQGALDVQGDISTQGAINAPALALNNATISDTLRVTGRTTLDTTNIIGQLLLQGNSSASHDAGDNVPALKIQLEGQNSPHRNTNFIEFVSGGNVLGRVEGMNIGQELLGYTEGLVNAGLMLMSVMASDTSAADFTSYNIDITGDFDAESAVYDTDDAGSALGNAMATVIGNFTTNFGIDMLSHTKSVAKEVVTSIIKIVGCFWAGAGVPDLIANLVDLGLEALDMTLTVWGTAGWAGTTPGTGGIAYESVGADYAEWLPKSWADESLVPGQIVGVKKGEISKSFDTAERFMVISTNPTVVGAMPEAGTEAAFAKVAFMGQVPTRVLAPVKRGDFILPSGQEDGLGMAVSPENMRSADYRRIVGIAWSDSEPGDFISDINVAVGFQSNAIADKVSQLEQAVAEVQQILMDTHPEAENLVQYKVDFIPEAQPTNPSRVAKTEEEDLVSSDRAATYAPAYTTAVPLRERMIREIEEQLETTGAKQEKLENQISRAFEIAAEVTGRTGVDLMSLPYLKEVFEDPTNPEVRNRALSHYKQMNALFDQVLVAAQRENEKQRKVNPSEAIHPELADPFLLLRPFEEQQAIQERVKRDMSNQPNAKQ